MSAAAFDLLVIGAGINGAGIARDAAGRGLSVLVVEQDDIAAATSQWSTKLIHGGLRYLEYYEFRLVRESLSEREIVLRQAPHLVAPLQFVLAHEPHLRPAWMIRMGLFMYDHLSRRVTLPASFGVNLAGSKWGAGLKPRFGKGFVYADARVDDARLVLANEMAARDLGADVRVRTRLTGAVRQQGHWRATLTGPDGTTTEVTARAIANVAGPWVKVIRDAVGATPSKENVRHVKGSHIVVPRVHAENHAYLLQNADNRIVFVIPFEGRYSLIGTTDVPVTEFERPEISATEVDYLLDLANTYLDRPLTKADVVWTFSGIRPLYDDGASDPSAITRDYVLKLDGGGDAGAPLLSVYGGKITTYRKLAEHVMDELQPFFPKMKPGWTKDVPLPGGDLPAGGLAAWTAELARRYPAVPADVVAGLARRHGSLAPKILGDEQTPASLGEIFGNGLTAAEVRYMVREEWARTADDVLWRRSKCGLGLDDAARARVAACVAQARAAA
ncbi:MAG: glycerol-3-phosphate dehydrogenase [Betaproteobacteria bacterium]